MDLMIASFLVFLYVFVVKWAIFFGCAISSVLVFLIVAFCTNPNLSKWCIFFNFLILSKAVFYLSDVIISITGGTNDIFSICSLILFLADIIITAVLVIVFSLIKEHNLKDKNTDLSIK